ncbi:MAG TPA: hypothetical protein VFB21_06560 [Chthonomonadaceae bacterium]|nr:hypothetical protein [Chthonomonadaceae bacterium]
MSKRMSLTVLLLLAFALSWSGIQRAVSQQDNERKQTLVIGYPTQGIVIEGSPRRYTGVIYVKIYPVGPDLVKKYGAGPIASAELAASQRDVRLLPLGEYEVHFSMRTGSELKTFILRDVILRADRANGIVVEMNSDAKTTIIGGAMTAQQMADGIRQLQQEVGALKQEVAALKRK